MSCSGEKARNRLVWLRISLENWREKSKTKSSYNSLCVWGMCMVFLVQLATCWKTIVLKVASRSCTLAEEELYLNYTHFMVGHNHNCTPSKKNQQFHNTCVNNGLWWMIETLGHCYLQILLVTSVCGAIVAHLHCWWLLSVHPPVHHGLMSCCFRQSLSSICVVRKIGLTSPHNFKKLVAKNWTVYLLYLCAS